MRTVLDKETIAYEKGYQAFREGDSRFSNPYADGSERNAWFEGWDFGQEIKVR